MANRLAKPAGALALVAIAAGAWAATRPAATATAAPAKPSTALTVTLGAAAPRAMATAVASTGTVMAWREISVGTEVGGLAVTELLADEGQPVSKGQLLARLSDAVLLAQVEAQSASVAEAEANLAMARSQARNAQQLVPLKAMSREEAEQRETTVRTAEAKVNLARAALSETRARLAQTRILAPEGGTVSRRSLVAGSIVAAGGEILRIVQDDRLEIDALVPETDLDGIVAGQAATVTAPSGRKVSATVRSVAPVVDQKTRLGTVHVALPSDSGLKPGMFARVETRKAPTTRMAVPQASMVWRDGRAGVYRLVGGNAVELVAVEAGRREDGHVQVSSSLRDGDRVVLKGAGFLGDGDQVRIDVADAERDR